MPLALSLRFLYLRVNVLSFLDHVCFSPFRIGTIFREFGQGFDVRDGFVMLVLQSSFCFCKSNPDISAHMGLSSKCGYTRAQLQQSTLNALYSIYTPPPSLSLSLSLSLSPLSLSLSLSLSISLSLSLSLPLYL
ncbi:hypothetical protein EGW08_018413 [Elysia chlorotica]|uniref:Uncharacterized protein n=1 Tax=Elysia chlorotica TaxID=188477 RepID=A0A3S0ZFN5_ELYCH|nr:hypothetical protein EGW08_018413 [Elysia chlorotica]